MTALTDIQKAIGNMPPVTPGERRFVIVGKPALLALRCELDGGKPTSLRNKAGTLVVPIIETDEFDGWEVVDRPDARTAGMGGKHAR